jgi:hypothetical protein
MNIERVIRNGSWQRNMHIINDVRGNNTLIRDVWQNHVHRDHIHMIGNHVDNDVGGGRLCRLGRLEFRWVCILRALVMISFSSKY